MTTADENAEFEKRYGCDADTLFRSIGNFVFNFSRFEDVVRGRVIECLQLDENRRRIVMAAMDFAFMVGACKQLFAIKFKSEPEKLAELYKILDAGFEINQSRIRVAHGSWYMNRPAGFAVHTSRNTFQETEYFTKPGELDALAERLIIMRHRLWELASDSA
jgi:hypothetical protein